MNGPKSAALAEQQPSSRLEAELQRALGIGEADLVANRAGRITRRQAVRLALQGAGLPLAAVVAGVLTVAVAIPLGADPRNVFGTAVMLVVFFAVLGFFYRERAARRLAEIRAGAVTSCEGPMSVIQERVQMMRGSTYAHVLLSGGERYRVPFAVYRVFEDGGRYRAFFMPESKVVVAIEALDKLSESAGLRHRHRSGPLELQLWSLVFVAISAAILAAGLLLENLPAAMIGLGTLLLSGFLARDLVSRVAMDVHSRLGLGQKQPEDPLVSLLSDIPVPLAEAGPLVDGFVRNEGQSGLVRVRSRNDRDLGAVAQYEIQLDVLKATIDKKLSEGQGFVAWVRQLVVLLTDAHAALRWLGDRSVKIRDYGGREIDGFLYQQVEVVTLADLGDEAQLLILPNERAGARIVDTYVIVRRGRLFGSVSASTLMVGDLDVRDQVRELAGRLVTRMENATRKERQ